MNDAYIVGIAGFLGSHLAEHLLARGWDVWGCDDLSYGDRERVPEKVTSWSERDANTIPNPLAVDVLFNCAGHARTMEVELWPDKAWDSNVRLVDHLLNLARMRRIPLIHASSCIVYGPPCIYRAQKEEAEELVARYDKGVSLRFANLYGCHQSEQGMYPNVLAAMKRNARDGFVQVDGFGYQTRDFLHISDAVRAMEYAAYAIPTRDRHYDICTGTQTSIRDAAECFGVKLLHGKRRTVDVNAIKMNPGPADNDLGFIASVEPLAGIKEYASD